MINDQVWHQPVLVVVNKLLLVSEVYNVDSNDQPALKYAKYVEIDEKTAVGCQLHHLSPYWNISLFLAPVTFVNVLWLHKCIRLVLVVVFPLESHLNLIVSLCLY